MNHAMGLIYTTLKCIMYVHSKKHPSGFVQRMNLLAMVFIYNIIVFIMRLLYLFLNYLYFLILLILFILLCMLDYNFIPSLTRLPVFLRVLLFWHKLSTANFVRYKWSDMGLWRDHTFHTSFFFKVYYLAHDK